MGVGAIIGGIGAGIGLIGGYKEKKAAKKGAAEQRRLDAINTANYKKEVGESVKRTTRSNEQAEGNASVNIGGSGFGGGSSMESYLATIKSTHRSDVEWMQSSGASNAAIQEREAAARQRNANSYANAGFIKSVGSSVSSLGGYNWG
jgi:hypothetical protein